MRLPWLPFNPSCSRRCISSVARDADRPRHLSTSPGPEPRWRLPVSRQVLFALAIGGGSTVLAAYATEQDTAKRRRARADQDWWSRRPAEPNSLVPAYAHLRFQELSTRLQRITSRVDWRLPEVLRREWLTLPESKRTMAGIVAVCTTIFIAWNVPSRSTRRFATKFLWHDPMSGRAVTLLTSTFSHKSLPHLAFNSIALWSIGSAAYNYLDRSGDRPRSTSRYEFLALFVAAGVFSAVGSHLWAARIIAARAIQNGPSKMANVLPSLGSSGSIYACLMVTGLAYPQADVVLIFAPFIPIPIGGACAAMVCVDLVGLVRGWQLFDHAAHLSGALYGIMYYCFGHALFDRLRAAIHVV